MEKFDSMSLKQLSYGLLNPAGKKKRPTTSLWWIISVSLAFFTALFSISEKLSYNQATILGVSGATLFSICLLIITISKEKRNEYSIAVNNAMILAEVLKRIKRTFDLMSFGNIRKINYPPNWLDLYSGFAQYLKYAYIEALLEDFSLVDEVNEAIAEKDDKRIKELAESRRKKIRSNWEGFSSIDTQENFELFSSGKDELRHWSEDQSNIDFVDHIFSKYTSRIDDLTVEYLRNQNGRCEEDQARQYVVEELMKEVEIFIKCFMNNERLLHYAVFQVHCKQKKSKLYNYDWGFLYFPSETKNEH